MPFTAIQAYLERLPRRIAEMKLVLSQVESIPYMDDGDRQQKLAQWEREANAAEIVRPASPAVLRAMGIGVRVVRPKNE